jgi:hypothetical protein
LYGSWYGLAMIIENNNLWHWDNIINFFPGYDYVSIAEYVISGQLLMNSELGKI